MIITEQLQFKNLNQSEQSKRKRRKLFRKNQFLSIALSNTFVSWVNKNGQSKATIMHSNNDGNVLFQYNFCNKNQLNQYTMISEDKVVLTERGQNRLTQIDLTTHQVHYFHHQFKKCSRLIELHYFCQTNLLCVQDFEESSWSFKLTYYHLPFSLGAKPCACHQIKEAAQQIILNLKKANNHSMITWFIKQAAFKLTLGIFDLRDFTTGKQSIVHFQIDEGLQSKIVYTFFTEGLDVLMFNIWEKNRGELLMTVQQQGVYEYHQVAVLKLQTENGKICESKIKVDFLSTQPIKVFNLGEFAVLITQDGCIRQGKFRQQFIYVNNKTEEVIIVYQKTYIIEVEFWFFHYPQYANNLIYEGICLKSMKKCPKDALTITKKSIFSWPQVALHFLLHLDQSFDDDLLKEAVELITYPQELNEKRKQEEQKIRQEWSVQRSQFDKFIKFARFLYFEPIQQEQSWQHLERQMLKQEQIRCNFSSLDYQS